MACRESKLQPTAADRTLGDDADQLAREFMEQRPNKAVRKTQKDYRTHSPTR